MPSLTENESAEKKIHAGGGEKGYASMTIVKKKERTLPPEKNLYPKTVTNTPRKASKRGKKSWLGN